MRDLKNLTKEELEFIKEEHCLFDPNDKYDLKEIVDNYPLRTILQSIPGIQSITTDDQEFLKQTFDFIRFEDDGHDDKFEEAGWFNEKDPATIARLASEILEYGNESDKYIFNKNFGGSYESY